MVSASIHSGPEMPRITKTEVGFWEPKNRGRRLINSDPLRKFATSTKAVVGRAADQQIIAFPLTAPGPQVGKAKPRTRLLVVQWSERLVISQCVNTSDALRGHILRRTLARAV
jgi:hypothetical protein